MGKDRKVAAERRLTVGEAARRSGVAVSTLHFYEAKGLITSSRSAGNQRRYPAIVLRYIAIIKVAQRTGISLESIRTAFSRYPAAAKLTAAQWQEMSSQWKHELDERIARLTRLRNELDNCIGCGCLSLDDCPLRNPNDVLGRNGPGAHILERS